MAGIRASKGGVEEQVFLANAFIDYRDSVNRSIKGLRKEGYTYSHGYKFINNFILNEYEDRDLIPTLSEFGEDWRAIANAVNHMVKFREYKGSTVEEMRDIEKRRMDTIREKGLVPEDISDRRLKNFMRFLGWEESREIIDHYGDSNELIEIIWEAYDKRGNSRNKMAKVFAEYLSDYERDPYHEVDITDYFQKLGIKRKRWY